MRTHIYLYSSMRQCGTAEYYHGVALVKASNVSNAGTERERERERESSLCQIVWCVLLRKSAACI